MRILTLAAAAFAGAYGLATSRRPGTPLYYKIVSYGFCCCLLAAVYSSLFEHLVSGQAAFHPGYLGYAGTFFFLFSSYFGALDRLADGGEKKYRIYRLAALIPPLLILGVGLWQYVSGGSLIKLLVLMPVAASSYYACKHLIMPDVEMGIIRVMRPSNALLLLLCVIQPLAMNTVLGGQCPAAVEIIHAILLAVALPMAGKGCAKWFT